MDLLNMKYGSQMEVSILKSLFIFRPHMVMKPLYIWAVGNV